MDTDDWSDNLGGVKDQEQKIPPPSSPREEGVPAIEASTDGTPAASEPGEQPGAGDKDDTGGEGSQEAGRESNSGGNREVEPPAVTATRATTTTTALRSRPRRWNSSRRPKKQKSRPS
jgi:hypothetical protein